MKHITQVHRLVVKAKKASDQMHKSRALFKEVGYLSATIIKLNWK